MTEVEFAHLLSELTETAKTLNKESDSVNNLINHFEETLKGTNLGMGAWIGEIRSEEWFNVDEGRDGEEVVTEKGTDDTELGFAKDHGEWRLMLREVRYRENERGGYAPLGEPHRLVRLVDGSREERIAALALFPALAKELKGLGDRAIKTIQDAKKFVK
jgi:hypothetical protein